jgi:hypothetical protein
MNYVLQYNGVQDRIRRSVIKKKPSFFIWKLNPFTPHNIISTKNVEWCLKHFSYLYSLLWKVAVSDSNYLELPDDIIKWTTMQPKVLPGTCFEHKKTILEHHSHIENLEYKNKY